MKDADKILNILVAAGHLPMEIVHQAQKIIEMFPDIPPLKEKKSMADYKKAWKARNRDHYLAKNREYVARSRAKKK